MGDKDAQETNIPNADLAHHHLRAMGIRAEDMQRNLKGIAERIAQLESSKPWGPTKEYGKPFEDQYLAGKNKDGGGGAQFVRGHVTELGDEAIHGLAMADWAVSNSVDLDASSAGMYQVGDKGGLSDQLATGMVNTQNGLAENARKQNEDSERLK
jgi:hypothetical protein